MAAAGPRVAPTVSRFTPPAPWEGLHPDYFKSAAYGENPAWTSVVGVPKAVFDEMGGFPEEYWYGEDHDLWGKIALKYPVAFSWEYGAVYHLDAENRASSKTPPLDYEEPIVKTARKALESGAVLPEIAGSVREYANKKEIIRAELNLIAGNSRAAREILRRCNTRLFYKKKLKLYIMAIVPYPMLVRFHGILEIFPV